MLRIDPAPKLDYSQVMMVPQFRADGPASRNNVYLENEQHIVPIIAANMDGVGTFEMARALCEFNMMTALHKHYKVEELVEFYLNVLEPTYVPNVLYSMGINGEDLRKFHHFYLGVSGKMNAYLPTVCVDVANGYTAATASAIRYLKQAYPIKIMAGNVVTVDGVNHLAEAGADIIKIGVGPGSVCTTRNLTGIGYPQFSAVLECVRSRYHDGKRVTFVADGGITNPGDAAKAFAAGADYVMLGGMLAGHQEGGGEPCDVAGNEHYIQGAQGFTPNYMPLTHRKFYGMASKTAQDAHNGGVAEYRASEGKEVLVPYRGPVKNTVKEILGGLRSSCAYQGCRKLSELAEDPQFIIVSNQTNNIFGAA